MGMGNGAMAMGRERELMWEYKKRLEYPVKIKNPNPALAKVIISQLGGPDGEVGAAMRYLNQRYVAPCNEVKAILSDVGTEELAHMEIISAILYQLTKGLSIKEIKESGFDTYFVDHTTGIYPQAASGVPFTTLTLQSTGDPITDLTEDLAAEGTMVKEQLTIPAPEKALFNAGFRTFVPHAQNRCLRPHKNNKLQNYDRASCFQGKNIKGRICRVSNSSADTSFLL